MSRIPGEVPCFDDQKLADRIIEKTRKNPQKDPRAQTILEHWIRRSTGISKEQSYAIGKLWLTKILGVSEETAEAFSSHDVDVYREIGLLHAGVKSFKPDAKAFWEGVHEMVPEMVEDKDLKYLIKSETDKGDNAWAMIETIDEVKCVGGFLTTHLVSNATLYK